MQHDISRQAADNVSSSTLSAIEVAGHRLRLLRDGKEAFPAMLQAIDNAKQEVLLDMYWFDSDRTGQKFADAFKRAAQRGIKVKISYDAAGSINADTRMFEEMVEAGCKVRQYHPIAPWRTHFRLGAVNNRNHRKMLIVDQTLSYTGGINLADAWAPESEGGEGWRDDVIEIDGPATLQMRQLFFSTWLRHGPHPLRRVPFAFSSLKHPSFHPGAAVSIVANEYLKYRSLIRPAYIDRICAAKKTIYITNSYFVPDPKIKRSLVAAAKRGVEVRILLPDEIDILSVQYASQQLYDQFLRNGVHVHQWKRSVLHSKTAVIDGSWCTVGTYNLDYRSWNFNLEVAAMIEDEQFSALMDAQFLSDLKRSKEIHLAEWRERPAHDKLLERFFYMFRKLL